MSEASRLNCGLAGVLAAKAAAEVRNDHPHFIFAQPKCPRQLRTDTERILAPRPNGQLSIFPFGHRRAWFERGVLHIGDSIGLPERLRRLREIGGERILEHSAAGML